jgi:hypothetical protein
MAPSSLEVIELLDSDDDKNNNSNDKKPPAQPGRIRKRAVPSGRNNNINFKSHEVINLHTEGCNHQRRRQNMLAFQAREQANLLIDSNDSDDEDSDDDDDDDVVWIPSSLAMALKKPIEEGTSPAADQKLAMSLQRLEEKVAAQSKKEEHELMLQTLTGKAYTMVDRILQIVKQKTIPPVAAGAGSAALNQHEDIEAVAKDDMVFMAE